MRPRDYTRGVFRSGFWRIDIYRAFSTGLDGTPMPAMPARVSPAARWDLTNYIVSRSADREALVRYLSETPSWYEPTQAWRLPWR